MAEEQHGTCQHSRPTGHISLQSLAHTDARLPDFRDFDVPSDALYSMPSKHKLACFALTDSEVCGRSMFTVGKLWQLATRCRMPPTFLDHLRYIDVAIRNCSVADDRCCICEVVATEPHAWMLVRIHLTWQRFGLLDVFMALRGARLTHVLLRLGRQQTPDDLQTLFSVNVQADVGHAWNSDDLLRVAQGRRMDDVTATSRQAVAAAAAEHLTVVLKPYQVTSAAWALDQEASNTYVANATSVDVYNSMDTDQHLGRVYFSSVVRGWSSTVDFTCVSRADLALTHGHYDLHGGIIADDVGMGKTVITLALILSGKLRAGGVADETVGELVDTGHDVSDEQNEHEELARIKDLQTCQEQKGNVSVHDSREEEAPFSAFSSYGHMTLVVVPLTLTGQWMDEIASKVKNAGTVLPTALYYGPKRAEVVRHLTRHDVVITTYETLVADVARVRGCIPTASAREATSQHVTWRCHNSLYFVPYTDADRPSSPSLYDVVHVTAAVWLSYAVGRKYVYVSDGAMVGVAPGLPQVRLFFPSVRLKVNELSIVVIGRIAKCTAVHDGGSYVCDVCAFDATRQLDAFYTNMLRAPLECVQWSRVVMDESHRIATCKTKTYAALAALRTRSRWLLSGTPAPRDLASLAGQLAMLGLQGTVGRVLTARTPSNGVHLRWVADVIVRHVREQGGLGRAATEDTLVSAGRQATDSTAPASVDNDDDDVGDDDDGTRNTRNPRIVEETVLVPLSSADMALYLTAELETRRHSDGATVASAEIFGLVAHQRELCTLTLRNRTSRRVETRYRLRHRLRHRLRQRSDDCLLPADLGNAELPAIPTNAHRPDEECPICLEVMPHAVVLPCLHCFCHECLPVVLADRQPYKCGLCAAVIPSSVATELRKACEIVRLHFYRMDYNGVTVTEDRPSTDADLEADIVTDESETRTGTVALLGDTSCHAVAKYDAVVALLHAHRQPTVVFTHYDDAVQVLFQRLKADGHHAYTVHGSMSRVARTRAISGFCACISGVLVLSLRTAGVGLNLTHARRVVFLEPCLSRALEYQAIGRVHRLGLSHDLVVTHFIASGTIEERVRAYQNVQGSDETATDDARVTGTRVVHTAASTHAWRLLQLQALVGRSSMPQSSA